MGQPSKLVKPEVLVQVPVLSLLRPVSRPLLGLMLFHTSILAARKGLPRPGPLRRQYVSFAVVRQAALIKKKVSRRLVVPTNVQPSRTT